MASNVKIAQSVVDAFLTGDIDELERLCAEDIEFVNIPLPKATIHGKDAMLKQASAGNGGFPEPVSDAGHTVRRVVADGAVVILERVDFWTLRGKRMEVPVVGVFTLADGKVQSWTEYYDIGMYIQQVESVGIELDTSAWW